MLSLPSLSSQYYDILELNIVFKFFFFPVNYYVKSDQLLSHVRLFATP